MEINYAEAKKVQMLMLAILVWAWAGHQFASLISFITKWLLSVGGEEWRGVQEWIVIKQNIRASRIKTKEVFISIISSYYYGIHNKQSIKILSCNICNYKIWSEFLIHQLTIKISNPIGKKYKNNLMSHITWKGGSGDRVTV